MEIKDGDTILFHGDSIIVEKDEENLEEHGEHESYEQKSERDVKSTLKMRDKHDKKRKQAEENFLVIKRDDKVWFRHT